jgi:Mrp family chromosome partitioning ATPase
MVAEVFKQAAPPVPASSRADETPRAIPHVWVPGITQAVEDEVFRGVYMRAGAAAPGVLAVTSAVPGEGKSTLALALAALIAHDFPARRVLFVETDFERPQIAASLGLPPNPGLLECLVRDQVIREDAFRATSLGNLEIVPAGGPDLNPTRWLCSRDIAETLGVLRRSHDLVVLDLPAVTAQSGVLALLGHADRVLFVVRTGGPPQSVVHAAIAQVPPEKLSGVVMNAARSHVPSWVRRLAGLV